MQCDPKLEAFWAASAGSCENTAHYVMTSWFLDAFWQVTEISKDTYY